MRKWLWSAAALLVVAVLVFVMQPGQLKSCKPVNGGELPPQQAEQLLGARAQAAVTALREKDWAKVSAMAHPEKGIRYSPYAHVGKDDRVFSAQRVLTAPMEKRLYQWGVFDGSGEEINLSFTDYHARFVYDVDFVTAPQVGYNRSIGKGNTPDNAREFYPQAVIVEYHFPGFDPKYEGMDWRSLRLVFEQVGCEWYLVGVIHGQWTI